MSAEPLPSPSATSIRSAEPHDAAAIARVHIRTWQVAYRGQLPDAFLNALDGEVEERTSRWQRSIADARARRWVQLVAEDDDRLVGFVTFGPSQESPEDTHLGEVYAIYVDPSHWDQGYGRALFSAAVRGLTEAGFSAATLWVLETNERARRFYEIAGWVADGAMKTDHRDEVELREVRYRRALSPAALS
jgi:ribosomal protein S18 acetylase RimI-like enzyme